MKPIALPDEIREGDLIAAADIGSNSFHLIVARYTHGELRVIDRLRESVRLSAGLRKDGGLTRERREIAFRCLARFGQRLAGFQPDHVRAVATNAVRQLAHPQAFLLPAETALGHPIEVVSGREEARLIYQGVAHGLPSSEHKRLVIDIGGGSTEFIIGRGYEALERESLQVGCIASTLRFFEDGKITPRRWKQAHSEIAVELQQFGAHYRERGWSEAIGSSGTMKAIGSIVQASGWSEQGITADSLAQLREALLVAGSSDRLDLPGLSSDRISVIAGGVVILDTVFKTFGLTQMKVCETAMREGVLYDMLGRALHTDSRNTSISALADRYQVDPQQAARVAETANVLFTQASESWELDVAAQEILGWCAHVHEIGLAIAHSQYQTHGAYIVGHSDLAGFSRQEQQQMAAILRSHRRKPDAEGLRELPPRMQPETQRLVALLRLAVLLHRARRDEPLPEMRLHVEDSLMTLELPSIWLDNHALTRIDLDKERDYLKKIDIKLVVARSGKRAASA
ncbi:MAG TPA: exopolyphosphatase [Dokdonella sp.]|uniref:exopolyphosphatase n=1 Tax=Dokdonella sp. TaxID=2291710 RepID=UPI002D7F379C|nr:exopolyphosphatase [Dokdonella sp.]HET9032222.1 exopolyphosphatase [Dokdonella sp.]